MIRVNETNDLESGAELVLETEGVVPWACQAVIQ